MTASDRPRPSRRSRLLTLAGVGLVAAVALGFLGEIARPFDSFSHFRAHFGAPALLLALVCALSRRLLLAAALAAASVAALAFSLPWMLPRPEAAIEGPRYTLLQMNLRWNAGEPVEALRRIAETDPDIVTLQEMTPQWVALFAPLAERYPHQVHCDGADGFHGDSALLSKRPFVPGAPTICDERNSLAAARIDLNGVPLTVASHHQLWPWPRGQWQRLDRLRDTLEDLPRPILMAGDFNAVPWSAFLAEYAAATGTRVVEGVGPVWFLHPLPPAFARFAGLPLGNVLAAPAVSVISVERLAATTSDHLPVLVTFTVKATGRDEPRVQLVER